MYKIIGSDQKEYGPISSDQMRQWIAEGRVNGQTPIQAEGETGWKPLAMAASQKAKMWCWVSFGLGILASGIWTALQFAIGFAGSGR